MNNREIVTATEITIPLVDTEIDPGHEEEDDPNYLSISPRERLEYADDRSEIRAIESFDDTGQLRMLQRLLILFRLEAIKERPDDVVDFGCEFFDPRNRQALQSLLADEGAPSPRHPGQQQTTSSGSGNRSPTTRSGNQQMHNSWSPQPK